MWGGGVYALVTIIAHGYQHTLDCVANISPMTCSYVSIDKCPELDGIISMPYIDITLSDAHRRMHLRWVAQHSNRKHIMMDVFDSTRHLDVPLNMHDIIIIDIEPHIDSKMCWVHGFVWFRNGTRVYISVRKQ